MFHTWNLGLFTVTDCCNLLLIAETEVSLRYAIRLLKQWAPNFLKNLSIIGTDGHEYVSRIVSEELPDAWHRIDTVHILQNMKEKFGK